LVNMFFGIAQPLHISTSLALKYHMRGTVSIQWTQIVDKQRTVYYTVNSDEQK